MKSTFLYILFIITLASCSKPDGLLRSTSSTILVNETDSQDSIIFKAAHVVPTPNQYAALKNEFIAFIHFGPNTFTRMEWGNGMEDPQIFNLQNLDTDQWCEAMKAASMKMVVITVKHHDGFALWQTRYTKHGIMSTPFKDGQGDILKELSASCQKYGLKLGVYLSPADLYQIENAEGLYGNLSQKTERIIPRPIEGRPFENKTSFKFKVDDYNEYFLNQLFELLTEYGPIHEVWFDGAHPKRKGGQTYDYLAWKEVINTLAPEAVIFGKQDIRWCGNESGKTRDTEWNIIPYKDDPNQMNRFADLMAQSIGSRNDLYDGKYLHYQMAETNTSIREGWFYRDDTDQKVRSTDDVFDIYERSVGGNSIFLLNIPPNREGKFSPEDVLVLEEVGQRIQETYFKNLFEGAEGPAAILDNNETSYKLLSEEKNSFTISAPEQITTNRFVIQEAIATHSERIEKHALDAWVSNDWVEIATATNVGYKRILRFPEITSNKFRIRVLESRLQPAISNVSAHYYKTKPSQVSIQRDVDGLIIIQPKEHNFGWKPHGENIAENLNGDFEIRYTVDGSEPKKDSKEFNGSFFFESGEVKAASFIKDEKGSITTTLFGVVKKDWKLAGSDSEQAKHNGAMAFDADPDTYWLSGEKGGPHYVEVDLSKKYIIKGFAYTPQIENADGMIEKGLIQVSSNGRSWKVLEEFEFGNLINDPVTRRHYFKNSVTTRYIRIEANMMAGESKLAAIAELDFFEE